MDQLTRFSRSSRAYTYVLLIFGNGAMLISGWLVYTYLSRDVIIVFGSMALIGLLLPLIVVWIINSLYIRPLRLLWQAILFVAPEGSGVPAPDLQGSGSATELIKNLVNHVYRLADMGQAVAQHSSAASSSVANQADALQHLPTPVIMLDREGNVALINDSALQYLGADLQQSVGQPLSAIIDLSFRSERTLNSWLTKVQASEVRASDSWERVKLSTPSEPSSIKLIDLVAAYFKDNPSGYETMLVISDHTATYKADDQAMSFIAMAVHEMRTPLTILRGYIEALHDDLAANPGTPAQINEYLQRAEASGQQMTAFVNNILNASRVEDGQLVLQLSEDKWSTIVQQIVNDYALRAQTRGITLQAKIADDLPTVGVDRISIYQVLANLLDNAIKYSPSGSTITIETALGRDGRVQTTVTDHGPGIPGSSIPHLFDKFYRDHHNKTHVSGTGLGLYLSKTLVNAHGGEVWVHSKEGQGSEFGFSILPYSQLASEQKDGNNNGITRTAHGWIKNHSIYRG